MRLFAAQEYAFFPLNKFGDASANTELQARRAELCAAGVDRTAIAAIESKWLDEAKTNRGSSDRRSVIGSACRYLVLAQSSAAEEVSEIPDVPKGDRAAEYFHFAANELRKVDLQERSAQAYFNSAVQALRAARALDPRAATFDATYDLGVRSAGRARSMFDGLGEDEKADLAHSLRLDLQRQQRLLKGDLLPYALLMVWGALTRYGTSPSRWLASLFLALIGTTIMYAILTSPLAAPSESVLPAIRLHNDLGHSSVLTPLFLSVINLFAFGSYTNVTPQNLLGELALLAQSVVSFIWIGTGVTFLTRR